MLHHEGIPHFCCLVGRLGNRAQLALEGGLESLQEQMQIVAALLLDSSE